MSGWIWVEGGELSGRAAVREVPPRSDFPAFVRRCLTCDCTYVPPPGYCDGQSKEMMLHVKREGNVGQRRLFFSSSLESLGR